MYVHKISKKCQKLFGMMNNQNKYYQSKYYYSMNAQKINKIGVAIDIDGTLILQKKPIPGAQQALDLLNQQNIPFLLLTNNISRSEGHKANQINQIFQLKKPLTSQQVILSYTPIRQKIQEFKDQIVLLIGRQSRLKDFLPLPFIQKYLTINQYASIFPETVPLSQKLHHANPNDIQKIKQRLGLQHFDKYNLKIASILILTVPNNWQQCFQIVLDLLSTQDGRVSSQKSYKYVKNHIPVMAVFNDLTHVTHEHNLPRILMKPFTDSLKTVYKSIYQEDLKIQIYGKPQLEVFNFTKRQLESIAGPIDRMVMIGDNQDSDIKGAYLSGWDSIMVKSGVCRHDSNLATINAENIFEGLKKYLSRQNF